MANASINTLFVYNRYLGAHHKRITVEQRSARIFQDGTKLEVSLDMCQTRVCW